MSDRPTMSRLELLIAVRDQIRDHPETHDQRSWGRRNHCGTVACVAGWTVLIGGEDFEWMDADDAVIPDGPTSDASTWLHPAWDITELSISQQARELLGLTWGEARWLFHEARSYDEVLESLDALIWREKWAAR